MFISVISNEKDSVNVLHRKSIDLTKSLHFQGLKKIEGIFIRTMSL